MNFAFSSVLMTFLCHVCFRLYGYEARLMNYLRKHKQTGADGVVVGL